MEIMDREILPYHLVTLLNLKEIVYLSFLNHQSQVTYNNPIYWKLKYQQYKTSEVLQKKFGYQHSLILSLNINNVCSLCLQPLFKIDKHLSLPSSKSNKSNTLLIICGCNLRFLYLRAHLDCLQPYLIGKRNDIQYLICPICTETKICLPIYITS